MLRTADMEKKISVIVPVYNKEKTITKCINSILSQSYENIEVIAVDDGSSDNSLNILKELEKSDNRLTVIHQDNNGVSSARNAGLERAKGEYISFVDSDDWLEKDALKKLSALINDDVDIVCCCCNAVTDDGSIINHFYQGDRVFSTPEEKKELYFQLFDTAYHQPQETYTGIGVPWGKIYKSELFDKLRFDTRLNHYEDNVLNYELFLNSRTVVYLDAPLYNYSTDHIITVLNGYNKKIVDSYSLTTVKRYEIAQNHNQLEDNEFKEMLDKQSAELISVVVMLMIYNKDRGLSHKQLIEELAFVNETLNLQKVFKIIDNQNISSATTKLVFRLLKNKKYRTLDAFLSLRNKVR